MIEKKFSFTLTDRKHIERILEDDNVAINHIVLPREKACRNIIPIPMST